jgi:hypothetical protein
MNFRSNRVRLAVLAIIIVLVVSASTGMFIQYQAAETKIVLIDFDFNRAYGDEEVLTSIGPRPAASAGELEGARYVQSQFEAAGLENVALEQFEILAFEVVTAEVSLVEYGPMGQFPDPRGSITTYEHTVDFVAQGHSGSRNWRYFTDDLDVVFVGNGSDDSQFQSAANAAALVDGGTGSWSSNTELFFKAEEYGVDALILQNSNSHQEVGYVPYFKGTGLPEGRTTYPDNIPFFMVSKSVGEDLKNSGNNNQKVRINFDVVVETRKTSVVVGDVIGSERPNELVVLGAHMDTVYNGPGAVDNTVGTVTIIELARQLANTNPKRTIRLGTFGAEEIGIWGSRLYWAAHEKELKANTKFMFNFDMNHADLERGNRIHLLSDSEALLNSLDPYKEAMLKKYPNLEKYDIQYEHRDPFPGNSDHYIFSDNDIPFFVCFGSGSQEYHSYLDDISHVNTESLAVSAIIYGSYALEVANR